MKAHRQHVYATQTAVSGELACVEVEALERAITATAVHAITKRPRSICLPISQVTEPFVA